MAQQASRKPVFPPEIAPYIDVAAYLIDARAPAATLFFDALLGGKELLLLTRAGQADIRATKQWQKYFTAAGYMCIVIDSLTGEGMEDVLDYLGQLLRQKIAVAAKRGISSATIRMAALGVPNVGKSTFLNTLLGTKRLKVGNIPGVTRGRQWVRLFEDVEVLDTPGILRDPAALNRRKPYWLLLNLMPYDFALRESALPLLVEKLGGRGLDKLRQYYKIKPEQFVWEDWQELLQLIARARGFSIEDDEGLERATRRVVYDFQHGRFGRITLQNAWVDEITSPLFTAPPAP
jgi:ribosome biogenesis GTPase A